MACKPVAKVEVPVERLRIDKKRGGCGVGNFKRPADRGRVAPDGKFAVWS